MKFFEYLAQLPNSDIDLNNLSGVSIFSYSDDFKNFVSEQYGLGDSIFSLDLNEILSFSFSNGKMVDDTPSEDNQFALDYLNDLLSDEDVKKAVDANSDGTITDEEVENFFKNAAKLDGNENDVSATDVKNVFEQIKNGEYQPDGLGAAPEAEEPSSPGSPSGPSGPTSGGDNPPSTDDGGDKPPSTDDGTTEANLQNMSVSELNSEKSTAQTSRDEQYEVLNQIANGEGPVKDLKTAMDDAYTKMQTELAKLDSKLAEDYDKAKKDTEAKQKAVEDNENAIAQKTSAKSDAQSDLDNATKDVESINSCISQLNSQLSSAETEEEKSAIRGKISDAQARLKEAEDKKKAAQTALDDATAALEEEEGKTAGLKADLEEAQKTESALEEQVTALANKEGNDTFKALKDDYDKAKTAFEEGKAQAISDAKKIISEKQDYIDKINAQIPETQKAENEKEFTSTPEENAIEEAVAAVGGNTKDLKTEKLSDGSYLVTEKTQDGVEVKYTFDKDGNMTSYQNGMGTFKAKGDSTEISGSDQLRKWAKGINSYEINAKLEDIVKQIRSNPQAESLINMALGSYQASGLAGKTDICVKYANYVLTQMGHPIGEFSDDVKKNNPEISLGEAQTGDVYINDRHTGIILLHIKDKNGNDVFLTADGTNSGVYLNVRDGKDESLAKKARVFRPKN